MVIADRRIGDQRCCFAVSFMINLLQFLNPWLINGLFIYSLFYHSIRISLNRHFISTSPESNDNDTSFSICMESCDAICAIIRQVRKQRGMFGCPLILVYALVMAAITIAKVLSTCPYPFPCNREFLIYLLKGQAWEKIIPIHV